MRNYKKNYPLYETTVFRDFRVMTENVAQKYPDGVAFMFRENPHDPEPTQVTFTDVKNRVRDLGTGFNALEAKDHQVALIG